MAAIPAGAYRVDLLKIPTVFLVRSAVAWLLDDLIAFALRSLLFQNNVTVPFALTSLAFTGLFVLGWRALYLWWYNR